MEKCQTGGTFVDSREGSPISELEVVPNPVSVLMRIASVGPAAASWVWLPSNVFQDCQLSDSGLGSVDFCNMGR